jgi:hypothetical protein
VDATDSGTCLVAGFGISAVEALEFAVTVFVSQLVSSV